VLQLLIKPSYNSVSTNSPWFFTKSFRHHTSIHSLQIKINYTVIKDITSIIQPLQVRAKHIDCQTPNLNCYHLKQGSLGLIDEPSVGWQVRGLFLAVSVFILRGRPKSKNENQISYISTSHVYHWILFYHFFSLYQDSPT